MDSVIEKGNKPIDRWLGLFALAVGAALYLLPKTEPAITGCCILIWGSLVYPFMRFWWIEDRKWRQCTAATILTVGVVFLGLYIKPEKLHGDLGSSAPSIGRDGASRGTNPVQADADTRPPAHTDPQTPSIKLLEWHDEGPDGNKYEMAWSMDPACHNPIPDPATHHCYFTQTQMSMAGDNTPFDHWDLSIDLPGPVTKVFAIPQEAMNSKTLRGRGKEKSKDPQRDALVGSMVEMLPSR